MFLIQLTGLSGSGKTTLSYNVKRELQMRGFRAEVIDGDEYRSRICPDLGFSRSDRSENLRRLAFVGQTLARNGIIVLMAAINPFEEIRQEIKDQFPHTRTVWIDCDIETLRARDTKGLYHRASLPDSDPLKLNNLSGVNDPYDIPPAPDLVLNTSRESVEQSASTLLRFILNCLQSGSAGKKAMFIGRWQPFHNGHKWLIEQKLIKENKPVLIAVRDVPPDTENPLTTGQTVSILERAFEGRNVEIIVVPDIESVNYGRRVGYEVNELSPPPEIGGISATEIRECLNRGSDEWKRHIDPHLHDLVEACFSESVSGRHSI